MDSCVQINCYHDRNYHAYRLHIKVMTGAVNSGKHLEAKHVRWAAKKLLF